MKEALIIAVIVLFFGLFVSYSVSQSEKEECAQWLKQSKEIKGYYVTDWQIKECDTYNIHFNIPTTISPNK